MKRMRPFPWVIGATTLVMLLGINLGYRYILGQLAQSVDEQLGDQLTGLAESFASNLDPGAVAAAVGPQESFSPDAYMRLRDQSRDFATANRLVSTTILDTLWQNPFAAETDSLGRLVYSLLDRDGQWALQSGLPWVSETYRWGHSYYRSAAAPIADSTGKPVGIVRLEADARYFEPLDRLESLSWWIHGLSVMLTVAFVGLFVWYAKVMRRWEAELLRSEKLIGLGRLAATIAHEIRNPLGIIKATAQRLEKLQIENPERSPRFAELLKFIPEETDRLDRVLTGYLRWTAPTPAQPEPFVVEEDLERWLDSAFPASADGLRRWALRTETTGPILASLDTPRRVVINLVQNALDASPSDQPVIVRWGRHGNRWGQLTISDRGAGIPRKLRKQIFEPFFTTKANGSGLGLYAVLTMVERDGGSVAVEDNPEGGAAFIVRWRLAGRTGSEQG